MFNNITTKVTSNTSQSEIADKAFAPVEQEIEERYKHDTLPYKLPSYGVFYNNDPIANLSLLTIGQVVDIEKIRKITDEMEKFRSFISIINRSIYGKKILELTVHDFYAICYWLRLNSYKLEPLTVSTEVDVVINCKKEKKRLQTQVMEESIEIVILDKFLMIEEFDYPRVQDELYKLEHINELSQMEIICFGYVKGNTPEEKLSNLRNLPIDRIYEIFKYITDAYHGIKTKIKVKMPDGEIKEEDMSFSFDMFLPRLIIQGIYRDEI